MSKKHVLALLVCAGLLAACAWQPAADTPAPALPTQQPASATPAGADPTATARPTATGRPRPTQAVEPPMTSAPDVVGTPSFQPQPGDIDLRRGQTFLDDAAAAVLESAPPRVVLTVMGYKPTGCHQLRVAAGQPDAQNRVLVEVYTVVDPAMLCTQVLSPFREEVNLGTFAPGMYTLVINDGELEIVVSV